MKNFLNGTILTLSLIISGVAGYYIPDLFPPVAIHRIFAPTPVPGSVFAKLLTYHNAARPPEYSLSVDASLSEAAQRHADWMADNHVMKHNEGDVTPAQQARAAGYPNGYVGQNIAFGYTNPESVVEGWMRSAGHRANILNLKFTKVGFGVAQDKTNNTLYWAVDFGG